jgi:lipoprotein NlpD
VNPAKLILLLALLALAAGCATRKTPAPVVDARSSHRPFPKIFSAAPAPAPVPAPKAAADIHTVKRGETLYSIALDHGLEHRELAQWNDLDDPGRLRVGQQLRLKAPSTATALAPGADRPALAPVQVGSIGIIGRVESRPLEALPPLPPRQAPKSEIARMEIPKPAAPAKPVVMAKSDAIAKSDAPAPAASSQFMWPVKGKVLAEFAEPRRKGIDIDGRAGDPIVAAAPGRVTYIGSGIPGMGKLVVIKHDNGFITVYGHNRNILVKEQQAVMQGQRIAELGSTEAERPKLHFQIRKGSAAVDPLLYLPK